jgi:transcriptional regulator with XRE-family HTH domain
MTDMEEGKVIFIPLQCRTLCDIRKGKYRMTSEIADNAIFTYPHGMGRPRNPGIEEKWPAEKRARFIELLDAKLEGGATYQEIAKALGLPSTRSLEHEFRYDRRRRPRRTTLELAAPYFGVRVSEIDGEDVEGLGSELELAKAFLVDAIGEERVEIMTPEEMIEALRRARAIAALMHGKADETPSLVRKELPNL